LPPPFERSVFINCPFDNDYSPILQAISFCVIYLGFFPRLAPENPDNAAGRLGRIEELVLSSKYGIHDLSRCKSTAVDQYARMNMPFELALDYGCRNFGAGLHSQKAILVLEENRFDYRQALSDISGWDIRAHDGDFEKAILHVRSWLVAKAGAEPVGATRIRGKYIDFQEWYWERERARGSSEEDIKAYPTHELLQAMHEWMEAGQPV
jgi:hypothetical protein